MNVIKKLTLDLYRRGIPQTVELVRGDSAVALQCTLLCDGSPWEIPKNASVLLRYRNGLAGGEYDTLPDGKTAYAIFGNQLTVYLAPAVCSMAGDTEFQVVIYVGTSQKSTLRIPLFVQGEVSGSREPESYTNLTQWLLKYGGSGEGGASWAELEKLQGQIDRLQANKADETVPIDIGGKLLEGYFIHCEDGQQQSTAGERCTDFIPVTPGIGLLRGEKLLLSGRRAFCFYDRDEGLLRCVKTGSQDTEVLVEVPVDAAYFRTSVSPTETPVFAYVQCITKQFADLHTEQDGIRQQMDEAQKSWVERIYPQTPPIALTGKLIDGYYIRYDGTQIAQNGECCTDFIPVAGGHRVHFGGLLVKNTRGLCIYDENKNFIRCLRFNSEERDVTLTMPEKAAYFRTSIDPSSTPTANYTDVMGTVETKLKDADLAAREDFTRYVNNISPVALTLNLSNHLVENQFISYSTGDAVRQEGEWCTDFVPVTGGYGVHFSGLFVKNSRALCVYDENRNFLRCLLSDSEESEATVLIPEGAAYFRTSMRAGEIPTYNYLPLLSQVEARLSERITALENMPVYNGEVENL